MTPARVSRTAARNLAAALLLTMTASGCALLPVGSEEVDEPAAPEPQASAPPASPAETEATPNASPEADPDPPAELDEGLQIARTETAESERQTALRTSGHETLEPDRLGYYMDVLGARLRQELAGQDVAIHHQDPGIRVQLSADATPEDHERTLDTIGRVLDEFRASLITVIAHDNALGASESDPQRSEDDALAAGRRLEQTGVAPERLVLRVNDSESHTVDTDTTTTSPRIELRIQPLAAG
ncbi:hypothetical protein [Thioalkalivibrio sp. ALJ7]|uniref:hypothetical protein n=1 Tax=Thioalkalivibrio sp. ALJ7 TaxID=1158756 RepID=UPI00037CC5B8|nr:hypothetical protein [Thioalkalivibrio sp. ALJ7]